MCAPSNSGNHLDLFQPFCILCSWSKLRVFAFTARRCLLQLVASFHSFLPIAALSLYTKHISIKVSRRPSSELGYALMNWLLGTLLSRVLGVVRFCVCSKGMQESPCKGRPQCYKSNFCSPSAFCPSSPAHPSSLSKWHPHPPRQVPPCSPRCALHRPPRLTQAWSAALRHSCRRLLSDVPLLSSMSLSLANVPLLSPTPPSSHSPTSLSLIGIALLRRGPCVNVLVRGGLGCCPWGYTVIWPDCLSKFGACSVWLFSNCCR